MTARVRQGRTDMIEANPQVLQRLDMLEKELANAKFSENLAKTQVETMKKSMQTVVVDRDALKTKVEILEQAIEIMVCQLKNYNYL